MEFIKIVCNTYEEALNKARLLYADQMRIHQRRDYKTPGIFGKKKCELTIFVVPKKPIHSVLQKPLEAVVSMDEASLIRSPEMEEGANYTQYFASDDQQKDALDQASVQTETKSRKKSEEDQKIEPFMEKAKKILSLNDFADTFSSRFLEEIRKQLHSSLPYLPTDENFEILLLDNIVSSFESDHSTQLYPPKYFVLSGDKEVGKSIAASKIANLFATGLGKTVEVIRLVDHPVEESAHTVQTDANGIYYSTHSFLEPPTTFKGENERDIYVIDSFSFKDDDKCKKLLDFYRHLPKFETKFFLVLDAHTKQKDVPKILSSYERISFQSIVMTKSDESQTIGNMISICNLYGIPLLFLTEGKEIAAKIHFASSFAILSKLKGFDLDINSILSSAN